MIPDSSPTYPSRAVARSTHGMVATPHPQATLAGVDILRRGGNAVDAAIAANAVLSVVYSAGCGVGGDAFWLVYDPRLQTVSGYNGSGRTPATASLERLRRPDGPVLPLRGALSVTVPGAVRSWEDVGRNHGRMGLDELLAPAEAYARDGYAVTDINAAYFAQNVTLLEQDREAERIFLNRAVPRPGDRLCNPDLATTFSAIRKHGADGFYCGPVAERIVRTLNARGNLMSLEDLATHRTEQTQPLRIAWNGRELVAHPPNSQGATMLMAMGMLTGDRYGGELHWNHVAIEALKLAIAQRDANFADPAFLPPDIATKLTPAYLATLRATLDSHALKPAGGAPDRGDTIYLCVVDADGGAVSLIESLYMAFGSGIVAEQTGVVLHNRGACFSLTPDHPNVYAGGKRPLHTLSPPMVLCDGRPELVFGTMGGAGQPQIQVQLLHHIYDRGLDVQLALDMPRWIYAEDLLAVESRIDAALVAGLRLRGHDVRELGAYCNEMGHASAIFIERERGTLAGAGDPRADSLALGY